MYTFFRIRPGQIYARPTFAFGQPATSNQQPATYNLQPPASRHPIRHSAFTLRKCPYLTQITIITELTCYFFKNRPGEIWSRRINPSRHPRKQLSRADPLVNRKSYIVNMKSNPVQPMLGRMPGRGSTSTSAPANPQPTTQPPSSVRNTTCNTEINSN